MGGRAGKALATGVRVLGSLLLATTAGVSAAVAADAHVTGEVLVGLSGDYAARHVMAGVGACGGREAGRSAALGVCRVQLQRGVDPREALARVRSIPGVAFAELNGIVRPAVVPDDPYFSSSQRGLRLIEADRAWETWKPVAPVTIAIVDSGIDHTHPDLTRMMLRDESGIVGYDAFSDTRADALDDHWHGTHVAGIAAAEANNRLGVAGVAGWMSPVGSTDLQPIRLMPIKVLGRSGFGDDWRVGNGIVWAVDHGARVISLSLVTNVVDQTMARAVSYAIQKGCVVVAAAGNSAATRLNYPAAFPGVISVAATDLSDDLTESSTYGGWVQMAAPGQSIVSTAPTFPTTANSSTSYRYASGSSMACPHVAGAAALLLAQNPSLTPSRVAAILTSQVDPYTATGGHTLAPGAGRLNVYKALLAAGAGSVGASPVLAGVSVQPGSVVGGESALLRVTLGAPAPASARLTITTDASVSAPRDVSPAEGATQVEIPILTLPVGQVTSARIIVDSGGRSRRTFYLRILPPPPALTRFVLVPETVSGGRSTRATLTLSGPAPSGGATIQLSVETEGPFTLLSSVTVPTGASAVSFSIPTRRVETAITCRLTAAYGASTVAADLTVVPATLSSLTLRPSAVRAGLATRGVVTLDTPAPPEGALVALTSSDSTLSLVEETVLVPAGATSASFAVQTTGARPAPSVAITARYLGSSRTVTLRLFAPVTVARRGAGD